MIVIPALLLVFLSILVIYTSSPILAIQQTTFAMLGLVCFLLIKAFDFRSITSLIKPFYFLILVLLILVYLLGDETRGSLRWISLGLFSLQPSEFAKIAIFLSLAKFWSNRLASWKNIFLSLLIVFPMGLLVFKQPDLGTTLTIMFIWFSMLIAANISVIKLFFLMLFLAILTPISWIFLHDYQKLRLTSFLFPTRDPLGESFHVIQSKIAVGSGQIWGRGLGLGTQSRLQFLPEFRTDFIFAFIAEELGFIGSILVIIFYSIIFYLCFRILFNVSDRFGELLMVGIMSMLFFQIFVNVGMNIGILPITGITLPFLSYGGSSILTVFISLGLIASVEKYGLRKNQAEAV